jgi:hypothetical protein
MADILICCGIALLSLLPVIGGFKLWRWLQQWQADYVFEHKVRNAKEIRLSGSVNYVFTGDQVRWYLKDPDRFDREYNDNLWNRNWKFGPPTGSV